MTTRAQLVAADALQELKYSRDAYRALEALVDVDAPACRVNVERAHLGALMRVLNGRFEQSLQVAEAAMQAAMQPANTSIGDMCRCADARHLQPAQGTTTQAL